MISIALVNAKPGTGKTTSAVWLAHAFHSTGSNVLLIDADPAANSLEWADIAGGFPFRIAGMPTKELRHQVPKFAHPDDIVIIDTPQVEDHAAIARSALLFADEVMIPCAPTVVEVSRTAPMRAEMDEVNSIRDAPARSCVLLNRCVTNANSTTAARDALTSAGFDVLAMTVPRLELFAQSYGASIPEPGPIWLALASEVTERSKA